MDELKNRETYSRMLRESRNGQNLYDMDGSFDVPGAGSGAPSYDNSYRQQMDDLYKQITERGPFSYNAAEDPLYGVMKDRYVQMGRMAMKDTMGQAAALTGGYGSSYGQAVGQQQYDAALQGLADVIPELYGQAYQQYQDEGSRLAQQYQMMGQLASDEYNRYRDQLSDWQYERAWQAQQSQDAYSRLYSLIGSTGYNPTDEELAAAGMSREAANALLAEYKRQTGGSGGSSGARGRTGGNGGGNGNGGNGGDNGNGGGDTNYDKVMKLIQSGAPDSEVIQFIVSVGLNPADFGYRTGNAGGGSSQTPRGRQSQKLN